MGELGLLSSDPLEYQGTHEARHTIQPVQSYTRKRLITPATPYKRSEEATDDGCPRVLACLLSGAPVERSREAGELPLDHNIQALS